MCAQINTNVLTLMFFSLSLSPYYTTGTQEVVISPCPPHRAESLMMCEHSLAKGEQKGGGSRHLLNLASHKETLPHFE